MSVLILLSSDISYNGKTSRVGYEITDVLPHMLQNINIGEYLNDEECDEYFSHYNRNEINEYGNTLTHVIAIKRIK